jgi:hypothetical protein
MKKVLFLICLSLLVSVGFGQSDVQTQNGIRRPPTAEERRNEDFEQRRDAMRRLSNQKPELSLPKEKKLTSSEIKKMKAVTRISKEEKAKHKSFLKRSKTGIFRLLPDYDCETKQVIRVDGKCKNFVPGIWIYSFRWKDYPNRLFQDISYKEDEIYSDGLLTQGILVSLGDTPLENINLESQGLKYLVDFVPQSDIKLVNGQYRELANGIIQDGFSYSNKVKVKENNSYALRSIAYDYKDKWKSRLWEKNIGEATKDERKFLGIEYDKREDSIYIFRVVSKSEDGGITVIWQRLQKQDSPKITFEEDEKLRDFKSLDAI